MDFQIKKGFTQKLIRSGLVAAPAALALSLAACGGGGSDGSSLTNPAVMAPLATAKSCTNVIGSLDTVQNLLLAQLKPAAQAIPQLGGVAAGATTALSQGLDAVDAVSTALKTLVSTQNPTQFTAQLTGIGNSLLCSGSSLSDSLSQLAASQKLPIPGLSVVQGTLATVSNEIANGLVGKVPGGDLKVLTNQLVLLATQLKTLSSTLPGSANQPYVQQILALNANTFGSLAVILDDLGALNGSKLSTDVTGLVTSTADTLQAALPSQLGVPVAAITPVIAQLRSLVPVLNNTLGAIAGPTLQAVSSVLGSLNPTAVGSATGAFSDLIGGGLADNATAATLGQVTQLTQQLSGIGGTTNLVTALTQAFGGLIPRP